METYIPEIPDRFMGELNDEELSTVSYVYELWRTYVDDIQARVGDHFDLNGLTYDFFHRQDVPLTYLLPIDEKSTDLGYPLICQVESNDRVFQYHRGANVHGQLGEDFSIFANGRWLLVNMVPNINPKTQVEEIPGRVIILRCFPAHFFS